MSAVVQALFHAIPTVILRGMFGHLVFYKDRDTGRLKVPLSDI